MKLSKRPAKHAKESDTTQTDENLKLMKRKHFYNRVIFIVPVILLIGMGIAADIAYHRPLPLLAPVVIQIGPESNKLVTTPGISWSDYGDQNISLLGTNLSANNGGTSISPMASTAKVMMALVILQKKPLALSETGPSIAVTDDVMAQYKQELALNESVVAVSSGEQLTEYQALEAMLIPSATNIADLLATWGFGSISAYTAVANQYAATLGMTQTHFADASGFAPGTVTTASDLVKLGTAAAGNPVISQIVKLESVELPVAGTVSNFNTELGNSGINGIKTGNTDEAGGVFLFSAPFHGSTIVGSILHAPDLGTALHDAPEILGSFESNIENQTIIKQGDVVATYKLPWGGTVSAVAQKDVVATDWVGTAIAVHSTAHPIHPNQHAGFIVGTNSFSLDGKAHQSPIVLKASIPQPSFWWRVFRR